MGTTRSAGVREAKARLSELLSDVKLGREWIITERGKPVARLVPMPAEGLSLEARLRRLEDAGVLERRDVEVPLPPPIPIEKGLAQRMLREDRDVW